MRLRYLLFILFLFSENSNLFSQCCTSGCCTPGTANFGVLEKGDLLFFSFFKRNYSDSYYSGDRPNSFSYLTNDYADYAGSNFSYGITNKFTVQASIGYFTAKVENFDVPVIGQQQFFAKGLSDLETFLKYNIFNSKKDVLSFTLSGGAKFPTGAYKLQQNNVQLTRDVQPGTGSYSGIFIFYAMVKPFKNKKNSIMINSRTDFNGTNPAGYQYGVSNTNTISSVIKLYKEISLIVMLRNENRDCDKINNSRMFSSSSTRLFASPGISANVGHEIVFSFYGDFPVYQYYAGTQLASKYAFSFSLSKVFELHKKPEEIK
ncbi:MAG TPA: hypothetical protein VNZ49_00300 [Bacteroidia bacterium]|jgi:hypothetical protein|nr:hypothetical protein [Bacteroidia bacterium]